MVPGYLFSQVSAEERIPAKSPFIPAHAGIWCDVSRTLPVKIPACAGMSETFKSKPNLSSRGDQVTRP